MFKLALKNIASKPFRAAATVLAIAVAVAMIFAMLSFGPSVYEYIYSAQTSVSGDSDIIISTNSSSDRIITVAEPLKNLNGVKTVTPTLTLYAMLGEEYVQLRGFAKDGFEVLQTIDADDEKKLPLNLNEDNVVISSAAARRFDLSEGDSVTLTLGAHKANFYICAIAGQDGYFLNDSPFLFVGRTEGISRLLSGIPLGGVCNEIYLKADEDADVDSIISRIAAMPEYSSMLVSRTGGSYIEEQADSLSAPVVLAGAAVFALAVAVVALLFMMSEGEKISLISKYTVIGASKKQILQIFLTESILLACVGAILGSALAVGVFTGILKLTLSPAISFTISAGRLFAAAVIGLFSAVASSLVPILRSFKGTIRQNQINMQTRSRLSKILCPIMILLAAVSVAVEFAVPSATAAMSVVSLIFALGALAVCLAPALRTGARAASNVSAPAVKVAGVNISRDVRFSRSVTMLGLGMTVAMLLFMAWNVTKTVFGDYVADFSDMIFVTNVRANADTSQFSAVDGVDTANKIVWKQGGLACDKFDKTMNILGTERALDIIDFSFVTPREQVEALLASGEPYVFLDKALSVLYGVKVGDGLKLTVDEKSVSVMVGGLLEHRFFSGNYVVMSERVIAEYYGILPDTVLVTVDGNVQNTVNALRTEFAQNNYYVVDVLTSYKWDMQSSEAVFDLIGTLAVVVALFIFAITVFASQVGRATGEKGRVAMLNAGMSKSTLLKTELAEHTAVALVAYAMSLILSVLLTACLIHALRLFGLYFEFMYNAWVTALVGAVMAAGYALVPVAFNFKKGYTVKKRMQ